jgi:hypothetical protein
MLSTALHLSEVEMQCQSGHYGPHRSVSWLLAVLVAVLTCNSEVFSHSCLVADGTRANEQIIARRKIPMHRNVCLTHAQKSKGDRAKSKSLSQLRHFSRVRLKRTKNIAR